MTVGELSEESVASTNCGHNSKGDTGTDNGLEFQGLDKRFMRSVQSRSKLF